MQKKWAAAIEFLKRIPGVISPIRRPGAGIRSRHALMSGLAEVVAAVALLTQSTDGMAQGVTPLPPLDACPPGVPAAIPPTADADGDGRSDRLYYRELDPGGAEIEVWCLARSGADEYGLRFTQPTNGSRWIARCPFSAGKISAFTSLNLDGLMTAIIWIAVDGMTGEGRTYLYDVGQRQLVVEPTQSGLRAGASRAVPPAQQFADLSGADGIDGPGEGCGLAPGSMPQAPTPGTVLPDVGAELAWVNSPDAMQVQIRVTPLDDDGPDFRLVMPIVDRYAIQPPVLGDGRYLMHADMTYFWQLRATRASSPVEEDDPSWGPWSPPSFFRTAAPSSTTVRTVSPQ